ncbi:MAG: M20/M25/M40 family metallo-hydrolase [bacterium]|nr:M20/M25/M40 family metallo-hydrolase [bacterium]MDI1335485.1 M20/M25/M40 family metallo-hydrolase [Lacunisphaera sp.]
MRLTHTLLALLVATPLAAQDGGAAVNPDAAMLRQLYDVELTTSPAHEQLRELVTKFPGRLSGSQNLKGAVQWAHALLQSQGADRTELQPVMVPHWERGAKESVRLAGGTPLTAVALGGSVPTPAGGLTAPVVELQALAELKTTDVKGKIVFFNRPMNPVHVIPGQSYGEAGDQRTQGPAEAAKFGAAGVLVRSLTHAHDDVPHTGNTTYLPDVPRIPAAALSTLAADKLSAALKADATRRVSMEIHSQWFDDAPSHNVIGELRGSEHPEQVILVGGHLDSWDIAPGAHDDGSGIVQSIEVLRLLKAAGYVPKHTIRCVCFVNEENGLRGATEYARVAAEKREVHLLALETDTGGFQPHSFAIGNSTDNAHRLAARWLPLFEPYGITSFVSGLGGSDVHPLLAQGGAIAGLLPNSQRYFDLHHTTEDSIDKVNPRELQLGAAALASLVYLVDQHGL